MDNAPTPPAEYAPLTDVRQKIAKTAAIARRGVDDITLVAVSKTHPPERIVPLLDAGHRVFGENRVQEAAEKWPGLRSRYDGVGDDVELHLIGQLQSNKADDAVALFDCIHSLDRPSLLKALAKAMDKAGRRVPCFIQVNVGDEEQKGGVALDALPDFIEKVRARHIPIAGLMCLPPADIEPAPFFALMAKLAEKHGPPARSLGLSMGMSGDYPTAIMLGATHIRVGSALFGQRDT
ncbi:MAG: YggS family pyridoxal phosphate-dependent enzyme [Pontixanthobacter sp.]